MSKPAVVAVGLALSLVAFPALIGSATGQDALASVVRIEYETKLKVPREQTEDVWNWLQQRYSHCEWLNQADHVFSAEFGDEDFTDVYYDTPGLDLLSREHGVRHRSRVVHSGPAHRKDGRELLQLKLNRGDETGRARSEIKFKIVERQQGERLDRHPLLGLIDREDREECQAHLAAIGVSAYPMRPVLTLRQNRRRVYISDQEGAFATLTLDACSTRSWATDVRWTEIELELNEIRFTQADESERRDMEMVIAFVQRDLQEAFPEIAGDQTSKYNHAFDQIEVSSHLPVRWLIRVGIGQELVLLAGLLALGLIGLTGYSGWRRWRRRRPGAVARG